MSESCLKHRRYNSSASQSFVDIDYDGTPIPSSADERDQVSISFGSGEVVGEIGQDRVCLGQKQEDCVNLRLVLATEMTVDPFALFNFDGVFGLSLASLALNDHFSFLSARKTQHPALKAQFAVYLSPSDDDDESEISFGGHNPLRGTEELRWSPVARKDLGYWQVQIKSVSAGGRLIDDCTVHSCYALLDTGTSLLGVPRELNKALHRGLTRELPQGHLLSPDDTDCRDVAGPNLEFDLGDHVISLGVEDYSRPAAYNMSIPGQGGREASNRFFCRPLLLPMDMPGPIGSRVFVFGEPMLRRYYTVFDFENKRIGFSRTRRKPRSSISSTMSGTGTRNADGTGTRDADGSGHLRGDGKVVASSTYVI